MTKYSPDEVTNQIFEAIKWFDENNKSTNVSQLSEKLDKFNVLLARFNEIVCDSFDLESDFETEYKTSFAEKKKELTDKGTSVAKAEMQAEFDLIQKRKDWNEASKTYRRFKSRLERFDKIADSKKQRVSTINKTELKNL